MNRENVKCVSFSGTPYHDLKGNCYFPTESGETLKLSSADCLEVFSTVADAAPVPFNRDEIYYQMADALGREMEDIQYDKTMDEGMCQNGQLDGLQANDIQS